MASTSATPNREELRRMWAARERGLGLFEQWEATQPVPAAPPDVFARIGALYDLLPPEVRRRDPDPQKQGIQAMRAALAVLPRCAR
jgi:hypothetical protein